MGRALPVVAIGRHRQGIEADESRSLAAPAQHLGCDDVVCNAVNPGSECTTAVEARETPPERHVDVLHEIAAFVPVRLVRPRQALDGRAVAGSGLLVELVLAD